MDYDDNLKNVYIFISKSASITKK